MKKNREKKKWIRFWFIKHVWLSCWLISTFCWATSRLTNNPLTCCSKSRQVSERCNSEVMNSIGKFYYIIGYLVPKLYAEGVSVAVPGSDAIGECMGSLAAWCKTVTTENDPAQFKYTAVLIPTLPLLNQADLITPFEELNTRFVNLKGLLLRKEGQFLCCRWQGMIKMPRTAANVRRARMSVFVRSVLWKVRLRAPNMQVLRTCSGGRQFGYLCLNRFGGQRET